MFDLIATSLAWFYDLWPSFGMAIVLLTLLIMIILTPLTLKQTRSMIKMQHLQPELKKIQTRYKGDRDRMNKEVMAFYQANQVNPMSGCLPIFVQAPVFIVLYNVIRGLTRRLSEIGELTGWAAGRLAVEGELIFPAAQKQVFYPDYLDQDSELFQELSNQTEMVSWGFDLSRSASDAFSDGFITVFPYLLMILLTFVTSWYQQRQIRGRNPQASINPQQQLIFKVMPFFLPVISFGFHAALVVYFVASNLYRITQQAYITQRFYGSSKEPPAIITPSKDVSENKKASKNPKKTQVVKSQSSAEARRKRTTAGQNKNSSHSNNEDLDVKKSKQKEKDNKKRNTIKKEENKKSKKNNKNSQSPITGHGSNSRITPPGTSYVRGKKKKRKKRN